MISPQLPTTGLRPSLLVHGREQRETAVKDTAGNYAQRPLPNRSSGIYAKGLSDVTSSTVCAGYLAIVVNSTKRGNEPELANQ
jgi:hypothetical protein